MLFKARRQRRRTEREAAIEELVTCIDNLNALENFCSELSNDSDLQTHLDAMKLTLTTKHSLANERVYSAYGMKYPVA